MKNHIQQHGFEKFITKQMQPHNSFFNCHNSLHQLRKEVHIDPCKKRIKSQILLLKKKRSLVPGAGEVPSK
jgi:hypothetical protein